MLYIKLSVHFSSVTQFCPTLCDPMDCSTPGHPVHHNSQSIPNSSPLSQWCHRTISSSVVPFSSCPQSFPASGPFQMSQFFASDGQSIGVSPSTSVLPMNTQDWSPLGWTGWISLQSKILKSLLQHHISNASILHPSAYFIVQHPLDHRKREFQENIYFCFTDYAKAFECVDHNKLWKILKEMGIPDYLTCLLRNLYAGQEATVRTGHGTTDWFQIGKGVHQSCILSPWLFNLHAEYIMRNAGLGEAQGVTKIAGRNINNLSYADDTTLMAESEEELKSVLMKVKEESEKVGLKPNIQKTKIMASSSIT